MSQIFLDMAPVLFDVDDNAAGSYPARTPLAMTQPRQPLFWLTVGRGKASFTAPVGAQC